MKSSASAAASWGEHWDSFVPMQNTRPCERINLRAEWCFASYDLFGKTTDIWDAYVTPIPFSRNSKMKDNNSSVYSAKQSMHPACILLALEFILLCSIIVWACFIHLRCMEWWIFTSLQASTRHIPSCWIKRAMVWMRYIFCCTVSLLLFIATGTGAASFGGSPSSSLLLLLSSGELMIVNVDEKNWNQVFWAVFVCTIKLRTSRERNPVFVHRKKVIFRWISFLDDQKCTFLGA